jgi:hypothetical protein
LYSLPESWDHLVTSIWFSTTNIIYYDTIVGSMLFEEMRRKSSQETSTSEVMVARGQSEERGKNQRSTSRSKSKVKKGKLKCWYFGKLGHLKNDCWKRQQASKEDSIKEAKEANSTKTSSGMVDEVLSICNVSQHDQHWFLDSGESNHMCLHKNWFTTYKTIDDDVFLWDTIFLVKLLGLVAFGLKCMMVL